ncbi:MAG TPA: hypothetical protein VGR55_12460 [Candidatus Acidoferrum sp.]|nr:hypothetical protein [Candidatus Acidoferrum sp.]HEV2342254.1 hypothetical protein [Candidatus Acidoferrales bacterium]
MSDVITVKSLEKFFEPEHSMGLAPPLEEQYILMSEYCTIHEGVPEDVRSYFNVVVTLYLYGWLYYPFYTLASERSFFVVEMALRKRFPPKKLDDKGRDPRPLPDLFIEAKAEGLLRDEDFPNLENRRANAEELNRHIAEVLGRDPELQPEVPYVDVLRDTFHKLRNSFAHPSMQNIMPPGPAFDGPMLAAEIINQLWPEL